MKTRLVLAYITLFVAPVLADRVFTAGSGMMFGRNSREPKYDVEFHPVGSPYHRAGKQESIAMKDMDGKRYLCFLPMVEETIPRPASQLNNSGMVVSADEPDTPTNLKTPDELLDVLTDVCLYRHEGWWTYEFCYHNKVRQLHLDENNKASQEFILGEYDAEATSIHNSNFSDSSTMKDPRFKDASQRYHAHLFTNGTMCDLTNQPRETEVRFVCSDSATMITSIKEISTCKYAVTVQSSLLCQHPLFQREKPAWYTIHCNEQPSDAEASEFDTSKAKQISIVVDGAGRLAA